MSFEYDYKPYCHIGTGIEKYEQIEFGLFDKQFEITQRFGNRVITYYKGKNFLPLEKNQWYFVIYLTQKENSVIKEIQDLVCYCEYDSIKLTLKDYPHICKVCLVNIFGDTHDDPGFEGYEGVVAYSGDENVGYKARIMASVKTNDISYEQEQWVLSKLVKEFEAFLEEVKRFRYRADFLKLKAEKMEIVESQRRNYAEYENSRRNTKQKLSIERCLFIAGAVGLKYLVKSFGGEIDLPTDSIEVPDNVDSDYTPESYASLDNQYNISFGAQEATLQRSGGGLGSLDVTITKEPGSSNLFCITDGTHTVHNVKGGTNFIKIDGIKYILPKLKG